MKHLKIIFSICLFISLEPLKSAAQTEDITDNGGAQGLGLWVQHINVLQPTIAEAQLEINLSGVVPSDTREWRVCAQLGTSSCSPSGSALVAGNKTDLVAGRLIATLTGNNKLVITGDPVSAPTTETYTVNLQIRIGSNIGDPTITREYRVIVRKPVQMVFALDRSGSMECAEGRYDWDACLSTGLANSRWQKLKDAMQNFAAKMQTPSTAVTPANGYFILPSDQFKMLFFSGQESSLFPTSFENISNFNNNLLSNMSARQNIANPILQRDGTSYGAAIRNAMMSQFTGADVKKTLVLLTDGEENRDPFVSGRQMANPDFNMNDNPYNKIQVFTIGVGLSAAPAATNDLSTMVNAPNSVNSGTTHFTIPGGNLITEFANNAFNSIFQNSSPQLVSFDDKTVGSGNESSTFLINKDVSQIFLDAVFDRPVVGNYTFKIERNGVEVTSKGRPTSGSFFASFVFNIQSGDSTISSEGKWTITAIPRPQSTLQVGALLRLSATADEHTLKFKCDAGQKYFEACDFITPSVKLSEAGQAITNATVKATIYEPGADIADLLARTPAPNIPPASSKADAGSCALQKYAALKQSNPSVIAAYENYQPTTINLTHIGNGVYTANGYKAKVTGVYKIVYKADAVSSTLGVIQRAEEQTINVRFPSLTYEVRNAKASSISGENNSIYSNTLIVQPSYKDCNGVKRYVGPGWENSFTVTGGQINSNSVRVRDECDNGKYTIYFPSTKRNPIVNIKLVDEPVYSGFVRDFDKPYSPHKWELKLLLGVTRPQNRLSTLYDADLFGKIGLDRRFNYRLLAGVEADYFRFKSNYTIIGATAGGDFVAYSSNSGSIPIQVAVGAGGGIFKAKNLNVELGGTLRTTLGLEINSRLHGLVEIAYYKLISSGFDFGTMGIGLRYKI